MRIVNAVTTAQNLPSVDAAAAIAVVKPVNPFASLHCHVAWPAGVSGASVLSKLCLHK